MPYCNCIITNDEKTVIIKTKKGFAWHLKSPNIKLAIEESLYIGYGDRPLGSKQVILSGKIKNIKNIINWELKKIN